jgi:hypothetical protein
MSMLVATAFAMGVGTAARADDPKCQDAVAKGSRNVGNQEQKNDRGCIKNGSGDVTTCVNAEGAKSATKRAKLVDLYATGGKCDPVPALGVNSDPNAIADGTEAAIDNVIKGVWGDPVDGVVAADKCSDAIAKRSGKKFDTELKAFRACVKGAAGFANQAAVDACVATGVNDAKAQSTVQPKLDADVANTGKCATIPPPGTEDGDCGGFGTAAAFSACVGDIVDCQACLAMNNSSNGTADCDMLDDGLANSSCGAPAACPLAAGEYTTTQLSGGALKVYTFAAFPFPAGGQIKQDVAAASLPNCIHNTVVPFPGGFSAPNFCVPALGYTTSVTQTGCGIGEMDSNGGSHFKVEEVNDTSNTGAPCTLPHAGCVPGADASTRVDITVGGGAGTCAGTGTVNAIVTVPVHTKTWQDNSAGTFGACGGDGVFNAGDMVITEFDQILDFTTDDAHSSWSDIDSDGCSLAGGGPAAGEPLITGECLDTTKIGGGMQAVRTVAAGGFGSTGLPDDGSFSTNLPNKVDQTGPFLGTTCGSPPVINFTGTATRCIP